MRFDGVRLLPANRLEVWAALNDPEVLQACLPGCEKFVSIGDGRFEAVIAAAIGPVRAKFNGVLAVADAIAGESYTLKFDLRAGAVGFGEGEVQVRLQDEPGGSSLHYVADARIGGKFAQLGSRLVEGTARKLSEAFFARFADVVAARTV